MKSLCQFVLPILLLFSTLEGRNPYHAKVIVGPDQTTFSESTPLNLIQDLRTNNIERRIAIYTTASPASILLNMRGLKANASFAANSTTLTVSFPKLNFSQAFTGDTRVDSTLLFLEYFKDNRPFNKKIRAAYAKYTPIDPIAGNPNSLMAEMGQSDYSLGILSPFTGCDCSWNTQPTTHFFQGGLSIGRGFSDEFDTTIFAAPLRYSYSPTDTWALIIDTPLDVMINGCAYSLNSSFGLGFRYPITPNWSITPIGRLGVGLNIDFYTGGLFVSSGLTSAYNINISDYVLTMTNSISYVTSSSLHAGGINFDYHLHNFIFKNGLSLTYCTGFELYGKNITYNMYWIDTAFTGSSLFVEHYDEIGFSLLTAHVNPCIDYDYLSVGASYLFGEKHYRGYSLNVVYQF